MKLIKLLLLTIVVLLLTSVTFANHSLDDSQKVADLQKEIELLEKSNIALKAEIGNAGSLTALAARMEELGFVSNPDVVTLSTTAQVASR